MLAIDASTLLAVAPHFRGGSGNRQLANVNGAGPGLTVVLESYEINTELRIAHFLAQVCHESEGFLWIIEDDDGTKYEGRQDLGNTETGDGPRYKGRGFLQLTGRANYHRVGAALGLDLVARPELAEDPVNALKTACEFWKEHGINSLADHDDFIAVTRKVNGGTRGLESRRLYLARAKDLVAKLAAEQLTGPVQSLSGSSGISPVLHRGLEGEPVVKLQRALQAAGCHVTIDGNFGPGTETAVRQFQKNHGLGSDGIVGQKTWSALPAVE